MQVGVAPNSARRSVVVALALVATLSGCAGTEQSSVERQPNVVVFLVDDLGWVDTGAYGSSFHETPAIDQLAGEGVRFTQFYSDSSVCSPTRASLMTGRYAARLQLTNWIGGEQAGQLLQAAYVRQLPLAEMTLGEAFRDAGYATGYIGKWHLGTGEYRPAKQGFDYEFAVNDGGQPGSYFPPYANSRVPFTDVPDLEADVGPAYLTDRLTDAAVDFIGGSAGPFLLVLSHYAVHTPLESKPDLEAKYAAKVEPSDGPAIEDEHGYGGTKLRQDNPTYAGMLESTDDSLGRVMAALAEAGLADSTIVVFVSDNGGLSTLAGRPERAPTSNKPLRAGKGWLYEGGIRIPMIVRWPDGLPGGARSDVPATTADVLPTLLDIAGLDAPTGAQFDGVSLAPTLAGEPLAERPLFWHFPHYHGSGNRPSGAVRLGRFKLLEWFESGAVELYDLETDLGEAEDLAAAMPGQVAELRELLHRWREDVGAAMPTLNPAWSGGE